ncbi:MAG TPA: carbohydrate kinase [Micromonosporaceae bacterium]
MAGSDPSGYAVVVGEALIDLVETPAEGGNVFRPLVGGAPLNVAAGIARLGARAELVSAIGTDALGQRIWDLMARLGVGVRGCSRVDVPTTLAVTSLRAAVPEFAFYVPAGPPDASPEAVSFGQIGPEALDRDLVAGASVLYCGSIALLYASAREVARRAWSVPGPLRVLDPNVRPRLLRDASALRSTIEEFASEADLVQLSAADATTLFDLEPVAAAGHLRDAGARAVVVTLGADGVHADVEARTGLGVAAPVVEAIDTTGAGDACMAATMYHLLAHGWPPGLDAWRDLLEFATTAASLSCRAPGGAMAMPGLEVIQSARRHAGTGPFPGRTG